MKKIQPLSKYHLKVKAKGKRYSFITPDGAAYEPYFLDYKRSDYEDEEIIGVEPMTAKELNLDRTEMVNKIMKSENVYAEEKMDGTRGVLHIGAYCSRLFSRRISTKTDWYTENTDSLPQLRSLNSTRYAGTILDGELYIPNRPFKDVSSTLNCLWDEAIYRQTQLGFIVLKAFDIVYYKGKDITPLPLTERKKYLREVIRYLHSAYIREVKYFDKSICVKMPLELIESIVHEYHYKIDGEENLRYPNLTELLVKQLYECNIKACRSDLRLMVNKQAYYEYIVATGGEGIILKDKSAPYEHKRSKGYLKVKKNFTREVIITGFSEPTKEYQGKLPDTWVYWEHVATGEVKIFDWQDHDDLEYFAHHEQELRPVSKYYAEKWVGNIKFGVVISEDEIKALSKKKTYIIQKMRFGKKIAHVIEVGECSGFDEATRHMFSSQYIDDAGNYIHCKNEKDFEDAERADLQGVIWEGKVIEVLANELFVDTGKLRHPRFFRLREDKDPLACTWYDHLNTK